jgi:hypothetical protein
MKRLCSLILVLVALLVSVPSINAQVPVPTFTAPECNAPYGFVEVVGPTTYYVVEGDNLWCLTPNQWRELQATNSHLSEKWRIGLTQKGLVRVHIGVNERIEVPSGMTIRIPRTSPLESESMGVPVEQPATSATTLVQAVEKASSSMRWFWLIDLLGSAGILVTLYVFYRMFRDLREKGYRHRELRQNPVTSGPPIVAGGVQPNETERVSRTLETAAVTEYVRMNPGVDRNTIRVERIGPVESGVISGEGMVGYADRARPRRIDPAQPGYRARFRFPDGREDDLMSLQGCMNPCYYGEGLSGFTFEPTQQVLPTPEPERPAPIAVPAPAFVARSIRTAAQEDGNTTVTIGNQVLVFERGVHLTVNDETGAIGMEGEAFKMTLEPKRRRAKSARTTPRTATGTEGQ